MTLDLWLVARLAVELREGLLRARVQSVSGDATGLRMSCYRRGGELTLRCTFDPDGPLLSIQAGSGSGNENVAGGWAGGVAPLLRGCTVESVQAVPDDRVIYLDVVSRSAFGVPARHRLAFELEPNKANILVLRPADDQRWHVLAAAKEVEGQGGARDVLVGGQYQAPPPRRSGLDRSSFLRAVDAAEDAEPRSLARLLGDLDPTCTPPLAREVVERALSRTGGSEGGSSDRGGDAGARMLDAWDVLRPEVERAASSSDSPVYAWPTGDAYRLCHVVALSWPPGTPEHVSSLNELCSRQQAAGERRRRAPAAAALRKRLVTMLDRCDNEAASLRSAQRRADEADAFRIAGESIYSYLTQIPDRSEHFTTPTGLRIDLDPTLTAKENAAAYFKRFKKARSGLPRIAQRLAVLEANRAYWEELLWQLEAAQSASIEELTAICEEIADTIGVRRRAMKPRLAQKPRSDQKRAGQSIELPGDATAYVGRSPKDNERITFAMGAPGDLWFHARGVPGAHVILKTANSREQPSDEQIAAAAEIAAGRSRAADAGAVDVDYTQRKHVRKQGGGKVGLVWYTDFKTIRVRPRKI